MKVYESINGFISNEPRLTYNDDGQARFYARIGINHFEPLPDGSLRKLDPSYHDMVQFGKAAERSAERFIKGDDFVAQGQVRSYTREVDGEQRTDEQFLARRIAHDPNTTTYQVQRRSPGDRQAQLGSPTPTTQHAAVDTDAVGR